MKLKTSIVIGTATILSALGGGVALANRPSAICEGSWYVDVVGAPFRPHLFAFHREGILHVTFPDAAEANNSAGMGIGVWKKVGRDCQGKFLENNADRSTNQFTTNLVVTFTVSVKDDFFSGEAEANYYDGEGNLVEGPHDAVLEGQRITMTSPPPVASD